MAMCTKPEVDTKELEIGMCAKPEVYRFPEGGAPSRVLGTTYQNPRFLYLTEWLLWTSVAVGRYLLCLFDLRLLVMWGLMDTCLMFMNAAGVLFKNIRFHHCQRYLNITPKTDAKEITHVLAILHYKEPAEQLYDLVEQLAEQPAQGKKVIMIGMEESTPDQTEKMQRIHEIAGKACSEIMITVHSLQPGEIPGTGSNHFLCQITAEKHFEDKSNVIFSKFDCNMRISGPLLQEIEAVWCSEDPSKRRGLTFMPNVFWSADIPDKERSMAELVCSFGMSVSANIAPYSMSFVSGSLIGAIEAGYTPPGLLSEDELMFSKKVAIIPDATTYRLSSSIMKIFYPSKCISSTFSEKVFMPKLERWYVGWIEVHAYLLTWLTVGIKDHPRVTHPLKTTGVLFLTFFRMYTAFVLPVSIAPMGLVYHYAWREAEHDMGMGRILMVQFSITACAWLVIVFTALSIQRRMYKNFECLQFHWKSLIAYVVGNFAFVIFPFRILWCYLKHGLKNQPVVHTAQSDEVKKAASQRKSSGERKCNMCSWSLKQTIGEWCKQLRDTNSKSNPLKELLLNGC
mmetsp:Transcript_111310/g.197142  ORF Transcript_111310/g.197142 Transcript_111310/m.197142 type:complete len:568 (-) Transcript_111310:173-1876(-)